MGLGGSCGFKRRRLSWRGRSFVFLGVRVEKFYDLVSVFLIRDN